MPTPDYPVESAPRFIPPDTPTLSSRRSIPMARASSSMARSEFFSFSRMRRVTESPLGDSFSSTSIDSIACIISSVQWVKSGTRQDPSGLILVNH